MSNVVLLTPLHCLSITLALERHRNRTAIPEPSFHVFPTRFKVEHRNRAEACFCLFGVPVTFAAHFAFLPLPPRQLARRPLFDFPIFDVSSLINHETI
uniref:Putative secreted protein n=1 Tax=Anopheles darlingi TaxID=43151 RepID=A0A2M4D640_ANODA